MKLTLRYGLWLAGLTLIGLIALLGLTRGPFADPLAIVQATDQRKTESRLYLVDLAANRRYPLTPAFRYLQYVAGPDADRWIYFEGVPFQWVNNIAPDGLFRTKLFDGQTESLIEFDRQAYVWGYNVRRSPDGDNWYFALRDTTLGTFKFFRTPRTGGPAEAITTPDISPRLIAVAAGDWLILEGYTPVSNLQHAYSIEVASGRLVELTPDAYTTWVERWLPSQEWLVLQVDGGLWKMRVDGRQPMPISRLPAETLTDLLDWIPQTEVIVAQGYFVDDADQRGHVRLAGVRLEDREVLWELVDRHWQGASPDGEWVLFSNWLPHSTVSPEERTVLEIMREDGSERRVLVEQAGEIRETWGWAPHSQAIFYSVYTPDGHHELWRVTLDGRATRIFDANIGTFTAWSPDGRYAVSDDTWVKLDGTQRGALMPTGFTSYFVAWADFSRVWQPSTLGGLAIGLLVVGVLVGLKRGEKSKS